MQLPYFFLLWHVFSQGSHKRVQHGCSSLPQVLATHALEIALSPNSANAAIKDLRPL
jgi:hypothetical protein